MRIVNRIKKKILKELQFFKGFRQLDILIFDDIFPHPISGFRHEEFTSILSEFDNSKIIVNPKSYKVVNSELSEHKIHIADYYAKYSKLKNKIQNLQYFNNINTRLFYCVFLNNIYSNINWIEKFKIPFVFTLYPGGGFEVNSEVIDLKLKRVFLSPQFRKVIVTQKYTKDYLINNSLCDPDKIEFIFGCVVPQISINSEFYTKESFGQHKDVFDIVFCAAKYTLNGEDKGYDTFIEFAKNISKKYSFVRFHIIGGFDKRVIDINPIIDKIQFYGYKKFEELAPIFKKMDIIISPNKPFLIKKGAFDGFPLGTVVEAALNGVVALVSDELDENDYFINEEEILIIENNSSSIQSSVEKLINNPELLYEVANKGKIKFSKLYSNGIQMKRRIDLLKYEVFNN